MGMVKLDDDVLAAYDKMALEFKQPLTQILDRQLARFSIFPPTVRIVPLAREALQEVEHLLGGGQIQSGEALVNRVRDYASITLGRIALDLSPAQKAEIVHRAAKRGMTPDAVVKELVGIVLDSMFDAVTPYR